MDSDLLTPVELSEMLDVTLGTLANWRSYGCGPEYVKLGAEPPAGKQDRRLVRYPRKAVERFMTAHKYRRTVAR